MYFYFSLTPPYRWLNADTHGCLIQTDTADALSEIPVPGNCRVVTAVVPGEDVVTRKASIPSRSRHKVLLALPYALEDDLSEDVEALHFALMDWAPGKEVTVAIVARTRIREWLNALEAAGLKVDALLPDYLLLPRHPQARIAITKNNKGALVIRDDEASGLSLDADALSLWWRELDDNHIAIAANDAALARELVELGGANVSEWKMGTDFTQWLRVQKTTPKANLLQGDYPPTREQKRVRVWPAAAAIFLALLIKLGSDAVEYFWLARESRLLEAQIKTVYRKTFPDAKRVVNPRLQMQRRINLLKAGHTGSGDFQFLLAVAAKVLRTAGASLEDINYRDNAMVMTWTTRDFAALDRLKQMFDAEKGITVELQSSGARDKQVSARFKLQRTGR